MLLRVEIVHAQFFPKKTKSTLDVVTKPEQTQIFFTNRPPPHHSLKVENVVPVFSPIQNSGHVFRCLLRLDQGGQLK